MSTTSFLVACELSSFVKTTPSSRSRLDNNCSSIFVGASDRAEEPPVFVSRVGFYFVTGEPEGLDALARERLGIEPGQRYDYWKAWERAERLRRWLQDAGFLEATADLSATPCGAGCVEIDAVVVTGKRVRFVWTGSEVDDSLKNVVSEAWGGYMTPAFLASDLESLAEGMLFERRYYLASVQVDVEETAEETVVSVDVAAGPRGARVVVELVGNETVSSETLRAALPKRSSMEFHELITFRRPQLQQMLEVSYASAGYLQAEIGDLATTFDSASGSFVVTIPVVEGEVSVVERIGLEGVERISETDVRSRLGLQEGEPFQLPQFLQGRSAIAAFYRRQGFPDVAVEASIASGDAAGSLVATYRVSEGPEVKVGDIRIAGNEATRESVIQREVALEPGEPIAANRCQPDAKGSVRARCLSLRGGGCFAK